MSLPAHWPAGFKSVQAMPPGVVVGEKLGSGEFGAAYLNVDDTSQVIKVMPIQPPGRRPRWAAIELEAEVMRAVDDCVCVPHVYNQFILESNAYIVMSRANGKSPAVILEKYPKGIPESSACKLAQQLLVTAGAIHSRGYVHHDITEKNIFFNMRTNKLTLIDFGLARRITKHQRPRFIGTVGFAAPELFWPSELGRVGVHDPKVDLYSVGAVVFHLLFGDRVIPKDWEADNDDLDRAREDLNVRAFEAACEFALDDEDDASDSAVSSFVEEIRCVMADCQMDVKEAVKVVKKRLSKRVRRRTNHFLFQRMAEDVEGCLFGSSGIHSAKASRFGRVTPQSRSFLLALLQPNPKLRVDGEAAMKLCVRWANAIAASHTS